MKLMRKLFPVLAIGMLATLSFTACNKEDKDDPKNNDASKATVRFHLTDAPADYDAVYVDIQQIEVKVEGHADVVVEPMRKGVYNLLDFSNGLDTLLVSAAIPAGKVSQVRLVLGTNNTVIVDGETKPLNTPSAQTSGLKLNLHQDLVAGTAYDFWIDFDAGQSVVETGNGKYNLKPVIRAYSSATNGRVKGYVLPGGALVTVYATNGTDTYAAIPNASGYFMLSGLPEGTYTITYDAGVVTYTDLVLNNIVVSYGVEIDLGTRVLAP